MAHGEKDYTATTAVKIVSAKIDHDLPVILVDRFDSPNFLWNGGGWPAGYDALIEAGAAYEGDAGVALRTSLAAVGVGESATIDRYAFATPSKKLSYSALFRINQDHHFLIGTGASTDVVSQPCQILQSNASLTRYKNSFRSRA